MPAAAGDRAPNEAASVSLGGPGSGSDQRCIQPVVYPGDKRHENDLLSAAITLLETRKDLLPGSKAAPEQLLCRRILPKSILGFFGTYIHFEAMLRAPSLFCVLVPFG